MSFALGKYKANLQSGYGRNTGRRASLSTPDVGTALQGQLGRLLGTNIFGTVILAVLVIFLIAALIAPVANLTTGLTIAHTGFTPNPNITATPGLSPILQVYPLFFVFIGLIYLAKHFGEGARGI